MKSRRSPLKRGQPPKRTSPVKKRNGSRQRREKPRVNGSEAFNNWFYDQPCAICGWKPDGWEYVEKCHAKTGGMGRKADWTLTFPGCPPRVNYRAAKASDMSIEGCHREMHRIGVKSFEAKHGVNLLELAAQTQARWQSHLIASKEGTK